MRWFNALVPASPLSTPPYGGAFVFAWAGGQRWHQTVCRAPEKHDELAPPHCLSEAKSNHPRGQTSTPAVDQALVWPGAHVAVGVTCDRDQSVAGQRMSAMPLIASLIGHSGSSAFRPTTTTAVSMSLTGSCFSSESAPGPSIMGVEDEAEQSTERPCCNERQVQAIGRTHLIHRPARDIIPPQGGARVSSYRM